MIILVLGVVGYKTCVQAAVAGGFEVGPEGGGVAYIHIYIYIYACRVPPQPGAPPPGKAGFQPAVGFQLALIRTLWAFKT